ncbi:Histone-lysine N-methyltransferase ATXR2 isoform B [Glycine soja]|uniref:Histone-lysine N-methyltransferase ATXR2 isoform B n=1 Tax=Glycine soja TaxID=3848 RepID=A0A445HSP9_GLYSO|nr:Histone-lysine N-methyltransferase ATXR2 isoform B [Glycine soja]
MDSICPIGLQCATEISALLSPPSPLQVQKYYHDLLTARGCSGIKVKQDGNFGKGLYADMDFKEGELVLKDPMLVGAQHPLNKIDCLVCSFCFCFIGSIELQIGRRLYMQQLRANESHGCEVGSSSKHCHEMDSSDEEESTQQCTSGSSKTKVPLPEGIVESLMNGQLVLPFSEKFSLPPAVPCPGGCGEAYYCSMSCAEADWGSSHSLLCTGESSDSARREALLKFIKHANETNDIFLLAAKAISSTMLMYRKLKAVSLEEQMKHNTSCVSNHCNLSILLEAWKPISMGHKRRWWDCIALPDDVDSSDEASFRLQIKMLAFESLQLLKTAIFDKECEPCILTDVDFVMYSLCGFPVTLS